jgi:hypothetical protein
MPNFVSAQYVNVEDPPPAKTLIRAVDDEDKVWWLDDSCTQGDWLAYIEAGGTIEPAATVEEPPA